MSFYRTNAKSIPIIQSLRAKLILSRYAVIIGAGERGYRPPVIVQIVMRRGLVISRRGKRRPWARSGSWPVVFAVAIKRVVLPERVLLRAGVACADVTPDLAAAHGTRGAGAIGVRDGAGGTIGVGIVAGGAVVIVIVHVDSLVSVIAVWRCRERSLVGVDVVRGDLPAVVAGQAVVELPVLDGPDAQERGSAREEAVRVSITVYELAGSRLVYIQDEHAHSDAGLADCAGGSALVRRVVGRLGRKGCEPNQGKDAVKRGHDIGLGEFACPWEARSHGEVDPYGDREEALQTASVSP